jgi:hypothetical protein
MVAGRVDRRLVERGELASDLLQVLRWIGCIRRREPRQYFRQALGMATEGRSLGANRSPDPVFDGSSRLSGIRVIWSIHRTIRPRRPSEPITASL